ncbi:AbgT family transporter [Lentzea alba]|uniref:AbgT family transporter n=1 Tax=Lentzea alba TaxID=2714351 RepID=UPI0039BFF456
MSATTTKPVDRVLGAVERLGNRLPNPVILFFALLVLVAVTSTVLAAFGATVALPGAKDPTAVRGLLSADGLVWFLENMVKNFAEFPPVAAVLVMIIGVGVAERSGLLETVMRVSLARVPRWLLPYGVAVVACQAHVISDAASIVLPPLAAAAFKAAGRHPVAGLIGGFACVGAGYAAGFTIGSLDALYLGITQKSAQLLPQTASLDLHIVVNYFFTGASSVVLGLLGGFLISRVLEPRLGTYDGARPAVERLLPRQRRALVTALLVVAVFLAVVLALWLIPGGPLRGKGGVLVPSPLLTGIVPVLFVAFLLGGLVYGALARSLRGGESIASAMTDAIRNMAPYVAMMFVAAQVIGVFTWSNLGTFLAVKIARGMEAAHLTGFWALLLLILIVSALNLVIVSGSALWSLIGPVFVPAFALLSLHPAVVQAAFRIGDSATGIVTPMNPYVFLLLALVRTYEPDVRLGTLMTRLGIFVVPFLVAWTAILGVFYAFGLPLGPGAGITLP